MKRHLPGSTLNSAAFPECLVDIVQEAGGVGMFSDEQRQSQGCPGGVRGDSLLAVRVGHCSAFVLHLALRLAPPAQKLAGGMCCCSHTRLPYLPSIHSMGYLPALL